MQLLGTLSEADELARAGTALAQAGGESVDALRRRIQERLRQAAAGAPKGGSGKGRKEARARSHRPPPLAALLVMLRGTFRYRPVHSSTGAEHASLRHATAAATRATRSFDGTVGFGQALVRLAAHEHSSAVETLLWAHMLLHDQLAASAATQPKDQCASSLPCALTPTIASEGKACT